MSSRRCDIYHLQSDEVVDEAHNILDNQLPVVLSSSADCKCARTSNGAEKIANEIHKYTPGDETKCPIDKSILSPTMIPRTLSVQLLVSIDIAASKGVVTPQVLNGGVQLWRAVASFGIATPVRIVAPQVLDGWVELRSTIPGYDALHKRV